MARELKNIRNIKDIGRLEWKRHNGNIDENIKWNFEKTLIQCTVNSLKSEGNRREGKEHGSKNW